MPCHPFISTFSVTLFFMKKINWQQERDTFFTALTFLTRIPAPKYVTFKERYLNDSSRYFPFIGLIIGLIAAISYGLLSMLLGPLLAIILSMALTIFITGAFHEDGFADMCDGFGGGWEKKQVLNIMKDSRLGTYGVTGLLLMLATKFLALLTLTQSDPSFVVIALIIAHPVSRFFSISYIYKLEYVQDTDKSKVKPLANQMTDNAFLFAGLSILGLLLLLDAVTILVLVSVLLVVHLSFGRYLTSRIGGYTGDCLGAAQQLSEVIIYLVLCAFAL